jgi:hypothetical protein
MDVNDEVQVPVFLTAREVAHGNLHGKICGAHSRSGQLKVNPFQAMEVLWGSYGKAPLILNLPAEWRRVVKSVPAALLPVKRDGAK